MITDLERVVTLLANGAVSGAPRWAGDADVIAAWVAGEQTGRKPPARYKLAGNDVGYYRVVG
jgi:hypothetical protein